MEKYEVFISYRRDGGEALACLISEKLKQRGFSVFYDVESLRSGKFNEKILEVIEKCDDVLVVLPKNGLDRCVNEGDWVRIEIAKAITSKKNIIPILMRDFTFPDLLPDDIMDLRNYNGISANMEYFDASFEKLITLLSSTKSIDNDFFRDLKISDEQYSEITKTIELIRQYNKPEDKCRLADIYASLNISDLNEEIAKLYKQASEHGYAPAQRGLGNCYKDGVGVEKNIETAFYWLCQAAFQGDSKARYYLARYLEVKNEAIAYTYLVKAYKSDSYDISIIKSLARCYEFGIGVDIDFEIAKELYTKAYELGASELQKKLQKSYWKRKKIRSWLES